MVKIWKWFTSPVSMFVIVNTEQSKHTRLLENVVISKSGMILDAHWSTYYFARIFYTREEAQRIADKFNSPHIVVEEVCEVIR
jgi:hypothetical protein